MFKKSILVLSIVSLVVIGSSTSAKAGGVAQGSLMQALGSAIFKDANLSKFKNQSCMSCHDPSAGFADPDNKADPKNSVVSLGSDEKHHGSRNAPSAAYAGFSPRLHWDVELYIGGLFWDGRASGLATTATGHLGKGATGDPLHDQDKGPFLNPVEMALGDQFNDNQVWEKQLEAVKSFVIQSTPGCIRSFFRACCMTLARVLEAYDNIAKATSAFERSIAVNKFNSKFDKFLKEQGGDVSKFGIKEIVKDRLGRRTLIFRKYIGTAQRLQVQVLLLSGSGRPGAFQRGFRKAVGEYSRGIAEQMSAACAISAT